MVESAASAFFKSTTPPTDVASGIRILLHRDKSFHVYHAIRTTSSGALVASLKGFVSSAIRNTDRIACVTSGLDKRELLYFFLHFFFLINAGESHNVVGGTIIPLEKNTVRFIDNFSTGNRGAASSEYFLAQGYVASLDLRTPSRGCLYFSYRERYL